MSSSLLGWSLLLLSETIMIHRQTQSGTKSAAGVFFVNQPTPRGDCHRYLYLFDFSLCSFKVPKVKYLKLNIISVGVGGCVILLIYKGDKSVTV